MLATLRSAVVFGVEAHLVQVQVDVSFGFPSFNMVGLPDTSVRESRDRVRSAIRNSGLAFPPHRVTVNLAPADIRKEGASFDLPIAIGILAASGAIDRREAPELLLVGELSLDGGIQPTRGVLPVAVAAREAGIAHLLLPSGNANEASMVSGLRVLPVDALPTAIEVVRAPGLAQAVDPPAALLAEDPTGPDLADVRGQAVGRRVLEIAAAGGHHMLLNGPPGAGKTMLARRLPGVLPPLGFDEALEVTAVHSVAGLLAAGEPLVRARPFRAPHHTISHVALVGGGAQPRPGEISLAHRGVLFLDELPEFDRRTLEVLRQPLEDGCVRVARAARAATFPARFQLVAAMNPCPCGYRTDPARQCRCTPQQVARYAQRISGPLRDRIDLALDVPPVTVDALKDAPPGETSGAVRARVLAARARQAERLRTLGRRVNGELDGAQARRVAALSADAAHMLASAARALALSARAWDRALRVARTIADLAGEDTVAAAHVAEALQLRSDFAI